MNFRFILRKSKSLTKNTDNKMHVKLNFLIENVEIFFKKPWIYLMYILYMFGGGLKLIFIYNINH